MGKALGTNKLSEVNFLTILFLLTILGNYKIPIQMNYFIIFIVIAVILFNIFPDFKYRNNKLVISKRRITLLILSFIFLWVNTAVFGSWISFINSYLLFYLFLLIGYINTMKHGTEYIRQFFYQFTVLMNIFSVLNLYQVVFKKPILLNFLIDKYYAFGVVPGEAYRTISVFGHPIVCGMFFLITFYFNIYILKSGYLKNVLQILLLVNIYSTGSRSAWLILVGTFVIYLFVKLKNREFKKMRITRKNLLSVYASVCILFIGFIVFLMNFSKIAGFISERFGDSLSANSSDISNLQRTGTIDLILNNFSNSWVVSQLFGNGTGMASLFMMNRTITIKDFFTTDNQYLTWLYEFGLIGMITIGLIFILFIFAKKKATYQKICLYVFIIFAGESVFFETFGAWNNISLIMAVCIIATSISDKNISELDSTVR